MMLRRDFHRILGRVHPSDVPFGLFVIWVLVRLLAHIALCAMSTIRPMLDRERLIAVWPPQSPLATWFERVWFAPLVRWDVEHYIRITSTGYRAGDGTLQFHPLYPLLARPLVQLGVPPLVALTVVAFCASILLVWAFYKLARLRLEPADAQFVTLCFMLSPYAFALLVPYSEALFLLCAVLTLYWAKTDRWGRAGLAGALATLTRQQGLFLVLPLLWLAWEQADRQKHVPHQGPGVHSAFHPGWLAILAIPAAYGGWLLYRGAAFGDLAVSFASLHDFTYSLLISPMASQVVADQSFVWPWLALSRALTKAMVSPDVDIVAHLSAAVWFGGLVTLAWRHLECSDRLYTVAIAVISFAYYTGSLHPYMGLARHLFLGFPVFLGLSDRLAKPVARIAILALQVVGLFVFVMLYGLHAWVP